MRLGVKAVQKKGQFLDIAEVFKEIHGEKLFLITDGMVGQKTMPSAHTVSGMKVMNTWLTLYNRRGPIIGIIA